jgi:hypothetical protein
MTAQDRLETKADFDFIEGPTNYTYYTGDPGDGVIRKIFIFDDAIFRYPLPKNKKKKISMAKFLRHLGAKLFPTVIDLFLESPYQLYYYEDRKMDTLTESDKDILFPDNYLGDTLNEFQDSLMMNKSFSKELMRVHYTNTQKNSQFDTSPYTIKKLLAYVSVGDLDMIKSAITAKWPPEEYIPEDVFTMIHNARLDLVRLDSVEAKVRDKFNKIIMETLIYSWLGFFLDAENRATFNTIKAAAAKSVVLGTPIPEEICEMSKGMWSTLMHLLNCNTAVYFIARMLKRSTRSEGARWEIALERGEPMTHIVAYHHKTVSSIINDWLVDLGMVKFDSSIEKVIHKKESWLSRKEVKKSLDDFFLSGS